MKKIPIIITVTLGVIFLLLLIGCRNNVTGNSVADNDGKIKIPLSDLSNNVKFYEYNNNGAKISYFAVLGSDGKPRAAFDACDVCGPKGYTQVGNQIKCNNCGKVFDIDGLGTENKKYGCWPAHLSNEIEGNNIVIRTADLESSKFRR